MYKINYLLTVALILLAATCAKTQPPTRFGQNPFDLNKLTAPPDTFYYPFYKGRQMIEIDQLSHWDKKIFFLEQSQPRAMPHSMMHPQPLGNEYFIRDTNGIILTAYNNASSFEAMEQKLRPVDYPTISHQMRGLFNAGVWAYSPQSAFAFGGYYKVSNQAYTNSKFNRFNSKDEVLSLKFGLIDTLGNIALPIEYDEIYPLEKLFLVQKNKLWGVIDIEENIVVPLIYDDIKNLYSDPKHNNCLYFLKDGKYMLNYYPKTQKSITLNAYDVPVSDRYLLPSKLKLVFKSGKIGLIDSNFIEVVPPKYDIFDFSAVKKPPYRVMREGLFGFVDERGKEFIACQYDYAENFDTSGRAMVLQNGQFSIINIKGQPLPNLEPMPSLKWKLLSAQSPDFVTLEMHSRETNRKYYGLVEAKTNKIMLRPIYSEPLKHIGSPYIFALPAESKQKNAIINLRTGAKTDTLYSNPYYYEGVIVAHKNNVWGALDSNLRLLLPFEYEHLDVCITCKNTFIITKDRKQGLIDRQGKTMVSPVFERIDCYTPYMKVRRNGLYGLMNCQWELFLPIDYQDISRMGDFSKVKKDGKYGLVNNKNKILVPIIYDNILEIFPANCKLKNCVKVKQGDKIEYIEIK